MNLKAVFFLTTFVGTLCANDFYGLQIALTTADIEAAGGLRDALNQINDAPGLSNVITIPFATFTPLSQQFQLAPIAIPSSSTLLIKGVNGGTTLDGGSTFRGLIVFSGIVALENINITNMRAKGGNGGAGAGPGGGGLGAGGGLFVCGGAIARLRFTSITSCIAQGGTGGNRLDNRVGGGGGGMGGNGGPGGNRTSPVGTIPTGGSGGGLFGNGAQGAAGSGAVGAGGGGLFGNGANGGGGALNAIPPNGPDGPNANGQAFNITGGDGGGQGLGINGRGGLSSGNPSINGELGGWNTGGGGAVGIGLVDIGNAGNGGYGGGAGGGYSSFGGAPYTGGGTGGPWGGGGSSGAGDTPHSGNAGLAGQGGLGGGGAGGSARHSSTQPFLGASGGFGGGAGGGAWFPNAGFVNGSQGGFGGGGSGGARSSGSTAVLGGPGGFSGGSGGGVQGSGSAVGSGGGGAALGAGIFVHSDLSQIGTLVIEEGVTFSGNTLIGGVQGTTIAPGLPGDPGGTLGIDIFLTTGSKLIFDIDTSFTMTSDIVSDSGAGGGNTAINGVIKQGLGTLTLEGQNTYTGNTIITNGTLINTGSLGPLNHVIIGTAGTMQGTGAIHGALTNNGILSPGNSSSTLPIGGDLVLNAGSKTVIAANASGGSTLLNVTGSATLGGTLFLNFDPGSYQFGQEFTVLTASGGISGTFSMVLSSLGNLLKPVYTANSVQIIFE